MKALKTIKAVQPREFIVVDVQNCARCGMDHDQLEFDKLTRPARHTHFATCPVSQEPIMLRIVKTKK